MIRRQPLVAAIGVSALELGIYSGIMMLHAMIARSWPLESAALVARNFVVYRLFVGQLLAQILLLWIGYRLLSRISPVLTFSVISLTMFLYAWTTPGAELGDVIAAYVSDPRGWDLFEGHATLASSFLVAIAIKLFRRSPSKKLKQILDSDAPLADAEEPPASNAAK